MKPSIGGAALLALLLAAGCAGAAPTPPTSQATAEAKTPAALKPPTVAPTPTPLPTEPTPQTSQLPPSISPPPSPTSTSRPTPFPAAILDWDDLRVDTTCLDVTQEYPQFENNLDLPIYETAARILDNIGVHVTQESAECDARLSIHITGTVTSSTYSHSGERVECFAGSRVTGYLRMAKDGYALIDLPIVASDTPQVLLGTCHRTPTPSVNWDKVWVPQVVNRLADVWGAPVAAAALSANLRGTRQAVVTNAGIDLVKRFGSLASDSVPLLIAVLVEYADADAAEALWRIGPAALPAVPVLIDRLEGSLKERESSHPSPFALEFIRLGERALQEITGHDRLQIRQSLFAALGPLPDDASLWVLWWRDEWSDLISQTDVASLVQVLTGNSDPDTRAIAALVLGNLGVTSEMVVQAFATALSDESVDVQVAVLKAIENLGPEALPILPVLITFGTDFGPDYVQGRFKAQGALDDALGGIGIEAIPALVEAGQSEAGTFAVFLWALTTITEDSWDNSLAGQAEERAIGKFLERCMVYYRENTG